MVLGTIAAGAALVAALAAAAIFASVADRPDAGPTPEVELRFSADDQDPPALAADDVTGRQVPDDRFGRLEGGVGSFADYRGKPLVVNFFASWCAECVAEMPAFESVHQELGDQVAFLGVNLQDQLSDATELVESTGVTYDIARDPSGALAAALSVVGMPSTYFVSADGEVVGSEVGALTAGELRQRLQELLA